MQCLIDTFVMNMYMDHVILLHFGGSVSDQFELVGMRSHVLTFENDTIGHTMWRTQIKTYGTS
jgi:hypothetical protein